MYTVLVTAASFAAPGVAMLEGGNCRILYCKNEAELGAILASEKVDAVISRTMNISGEMMATCPTLKIVSKHGAGYNNVDVEGATKLGIPVFYTPGANSQSVAELTMGLMISVARTITLHDKTLRAGGWSRTVPGLQLFGRTLGVVGVGNIGSKVARLGAAFGMKVLGYDPYLTSAPCEMVDSLEKLLPKADVLTLHCPLSKETKGLLGAKQFAMLPKNAIVLNAARGGIVDEKALAEAIASGHLFGAALDDFEAEPIAADHPFNKLTHVVMTPHIGASTAEALDTVATMSVENVLAFLNHKPLEMARCVNPSTINQKATVSA